MMKESYKRSELRVTVFEHEDVITTSDPALRVFKRDEYEGHVIDER